MHPRVFADQLIDSGTPNVIVFPTKCPYHTTYTDHSTKGRLGINFTISHDIGGTKSRREEPCPMSSSQKSKLFLTKLSENSRILSTSMVYISHYKTPMSLTITLSLTPVNPCAVSTVKLFFPPETVD